MDLLDTNILIGAFRRDHPDHSTVKSWLEETLQDGNAITFPPIVEIGFLRIVTHPKVFKMPSGRAEAETFLRVIHRSGYFHEAMWSPRVRSRFQELCRDLNLRGDDMNDALLAATAMEMHARLVSRDQGFSRFKGLRWVDPATIP